MADDVNALDNLKTLLDSNWNSTFTDGIVPTVELIYNHPKEFNMQNDYVLLYSELTTVESPGIGLHTTADIYEAIKIDIRVWGANDNHARKVLTEVRRILHSNVVNPDSDFKLLDPFKDITDLSDRMRKIYRYIVRVDMVDCDRNMT